jgi:hypothetical protein
MSPLSHKEREELTKALAAACYPATGGQGWNDECDQLMASAPAYAYEFLQLREAVARCVCDGRFCLNPIAMACPFCQTDVKFSRPNQIDKLDQHLEGERHAGDPAAAVLVARLHHVMHVDRTVEPTTLAERWPWPEGVGLQLVARAEALSWRADLWQPAAPADIPAVALLLGELLRPSDGGSPFLAPRHVLVQSVDALIHLALGAEVRDWNVRFPSLAAFAMELYFTGRERVYRLVRGAVHFGHGRRGEVNYPVVAANLPALGEGEFGELPTLKWCHHVPFLKLSHSCLQ